MTLCEELYFEINVTGQKSEIKKLISFLENGGLDDFFPICKDYICYDDSYSEASGAEECAIVFTNDDLGIEIDELDSDDFLEVFCRAARNLDARGRLYDIDDEEYAFISEKGNSYYLNADRVEFFNDELDAHAAKEEAEANDEE